LKKKPENNYYFQIAFANIQGNINISLF